MGQEKTKLDSPSKARNDHRNEDDSSGNETKGTPPALTIQGQADATARRGHWGMDRE